MVQRYPRPQPGGPKVFKGLMLGSDFTGKVLTMKGFHFQSIHSMGDRAIMGGDGMVVPAREKKLIHISQRLRIS